jgi:hypothetical protein
MIIYVIYPSGTGDEPPLINLESTDLIPRNSAWFLQYTDGATQTELSNRTLIKIISISLD